MRESWIYTGGAISRCAQAIELLSEYIRKESGGFVAGVVSLLAMSFPWRSWRRLQVLRDIPEMMSAATYEGCMSVDSLPKKGI